jgi:phosphopantothenoylcysteine decarboxylase
MYGMPSSTRNHIRSRNILIGCTGSVATIKLPNLIHELKTRDPMCIIRVVLTEKAKQFLDLSELSRTAEVYLDEHEWKM